MSKLSPFVILVEPGPYKIHPELPYSVELLRVYLNFGYYLCIVPYRVAWNNNRGFVFYRNTAQKVVCGLAHAIVILWMQVGVLASLMGQDFTHNADQPLVFTLFLSSVGSLSLMHSIWTIRTKASALEWFFKNHYEESSQNSVNSTPIFKPSVLEHQEERKRGLSVYSQTQKQRRITVLSIRLGIAITASGTIASVCDFFRTALVSPDFSFPYYSVAFLCVPLVYMFLLLHFIQLLFTLLILLIRERVDAFVDAVLSNCVPPDGLLQRYCELKAYIARINGPFGLWVCIFIITGLPFYAVELMKMFHQGGLIVRPILIMSYLVFFGLNLILASDGNAKVEKVKDWLSLNDNVIRIPQQQLALLLHELGSGSVGLKGWKFFTISYNFIGSIVSVIITYTVIALQWNKNS